MSSALRDAVGHIVTHRQHLFIPSAPVMLDAITVTENTLRELCMNALHGASDAGLDFCMQELAAQVNFMCTQGVGFLTRVLLAIPCSHILEEKTQRAFTPFGCNPFAHGPRVGFSHITRAVITAGMIPMGATVSSSVDLFRKIVTDITDPRCLFFSSSSINKNNTCELEVYSRAALAIARVQLSAWKDYRLATFRWLVSLPQPLFSSSWILEILHLPDYADTLVECLLSRSDGEHYIPLLRKVVNNEPWQYTTPRFLEEQIGLLYVAHEKPGTSAHQRLAHLLVECDILPVDLLTVIIEFIIAPSDTALVRTVVALCSKDHAHAKVEAAGAASSSSSSSSAAAAFSFSSSSSSSSSFSSSSSSSAFSSSSSSSAAFSSSSSSSSAAAAFSSSSFATAGHAAATGAHYEQKEPTRKRKHNDDITADVSAYKAARNGNGMSASASALNRADERQ